MSRVKSYDFLLILILQRFHLHPPYPLRLSPHLPHPVRIVISHLFQYFAQLMRMLLHQRLPDFDFFFLFLSGQFLQLLLLHQLRLVLQLFQLLRVHIIFFLQLLLLF